MFRARLITLITTLALCLSVSTNVEGAEIVHIGVLAKRGNEQTLNRWQPTADYLSRELPAYRFVITPLDFVDIYKAVESESVDFILANSAIYVELETRYGAGRIATMRNRDGHSGYTVFGGVIFARADNSAINSIEDLKDKRFAAVSENSFGGYMMAWREMQERGVRPDRDTDLVFSGTHDAVVYAVLKGQVDAGTVRTDTLERMQEEGRIDLAQLKILNPQQHKGFNYRCSTRLYPEWPFARLKHTSESLSHDVVIALLRMSPDSAVAKAGMISGWTVPRNYQPVHELMRELRIGPYADLGHISFTDLLHNYGYWLLLALLVLLLSTSATGFLTRLNRRLRHTEGELIGTRDHLTEKVRERTAALEESYRRLERISRDWNDAFDAISDPIFIHDVDMRIVQANPAYCEYAGYELEEMLGQPYFHFFPRMDGPLPACEHFPEHVPNEATELKLKSGEVFVSRSYGIRQPDNTVRHAIHILEDVTAQRQVEAEMRRVNRALRTLSLCNTTLVHAQHEHALMEDICNILIDHGGYRFAWVGYAEGNGEGKITPMAHAGEGDDFLQHMIETVLDEGHEGPLRYALQRNEPVVLRDLAMDDKNFSAWSELAQVEGYAAAIFLPLASHGEVSGVICIFASETDAFDQAEIRLLREMANDLAFGIHTLRSRIAREQAEKALQLTEEQYEELYENAPNAYISVSMDDGRILQFNETLGMLLGETRETLSGKKIFDLLAEGDEGTGKAEDIFEILRNGIGVHDEQLQMRHASGRLVWVSLTVEPVLDDNFRALEARAMIIDITERKRVEAERGHFAEQLQRSLLQAIRAIALTIEQRDPYTAGHQERVAELAVRIGQRLGLEENELEGLKLGAMIHDIGKISIPAEILSRPGKLNPEMYNIVKTHPRTGHEIISGIEFPWPLAEIVLQHHERMDGSGYPSGLKGEEILFAARILIVADVVEAMASHRPYRAAVGLREALDEIRAGRGMLYDADVVDACLDIFADKQEMKAWVQLVEKH